VPDYTKQLDDIVRLLSRSGISPWRLAAFAALLGVIFGAVGRAVEQWIAGFSRRDRMRRVLYEGIAHNFSQVSIYAGQHANDHVQQDAFSKLAHAIDFNGEDYMKHNVDVFVRISEYRQLRDMYDLLHRVIDDGLADMNGNCQRLMWILGHYITDHYCPVITRTESIDWRN
jgi:hypothetical protein